MSQRKYRSLADFFDQTGKTQRSIAGKLGVAESYISLIASGQRQPSLGLALRIEALTGVPAASLVSSERVA